MNKHIKKLIDRILSEYKQDCETKMVGELAGCSKKVVISYPFLIGHPELMYIGNNTQILGGCRLQMYPEKVDIEPHLRIGDNCLFGYRLCILGGADIIIGDWCLVASDVTIVSENHGIDPECDDPYTKQELTVAPVKIGNNCWIGDKVMIMPGVCIGDGCIIGGGSVVTKSIPKYSIAVGNPARVIKKYDFDLHRWVRS